MNTMSAVMSSGTGMGGCSALLVPLVAGGHGTAILHPSSAASNSSQLSVIPDSSVIMTAGNISSAGGATINFLHSSNALQNANLKAELKNDVSQNGQIQVGC